MSKWDKVWKKDVYSKPELREIKANEKLDKVLDKISIDKNSIVLDLGCGGGYVARALYNRTNARIYGVDSSKEAIRLAKYCSTEFPIDYEVQDITSLNFKNDSADFVFCIGVIEHVKNYDLCMKEITRVLKNDGILYVVSSNRDSFIYHQKVIREKMNLWNYGYQKNWRIKELEDMISEYGFQKEFSEVDKGIGNFKIVDVLDKVFSIKGKKRGRYIYYLGRLNK